MLTPRRLTQASTLRDNANGSLNLPNVQVEYASVCPFNCDNTRLLLLHSSYFACYDGNGKYLFDCVENGRFTVNASSSPRWSATNENVFTYFSGNELRAYYIGARTSELVHKFAEYSKIDDGGEADLAIDGRVRVLCGTKGDGSQEIFLYEMQKDIVGPRLSTEGHNWNNLYLALNGWQFLVSWSNPDGTPAYGRDRFQGIWLYSWDLAERRNLAVTQGHMDVGRDTDGSDVLVWASGADKNPICGGAGTGVVKIPLNGAAPSCRMTFGWDIALHISCPLKTPGEFFVSTYVGTIDIYRCSMNASATEKIIDPPDMSVTYEQEPKFSCSRDGTKGVFNEGDDVWMADLSAARPSQPSPSEPSTIIVPAVPDVIPSRRKQWTARGRILYIDNEPVGTVDSLDLTAQIVERMNQ